MTVPTIYRSGDTSAPVLTGTAGALTNLLDKCLVDGYGSKSGAGWTKAFTATNQRSYRQGAGNQFYLDVDDRGAGGVLTGASGKEAAVRSYEAMTAVSTGTNPFPTTAQVAANTANWRKSATADSFSRAWLVVADDRTFFIAVSTGDYTGTRYSSHYFGDFYSVSSGDSYRTCLYTRTSADTSYTSNVGGQFGYNGLTFLGGANAGMYAARRFDGTGTSINALPVFFEGGSVEPNAVPFLPDNTVLISKGWIGDSNQGVTPWIRGWHRGVYLVHTPGILNDGDTILGIGDYAGRSFVILKSLFASGTGSCLAIETTPWDTSN